MEGKKVLFVSDLPSVGAKDALANLIGITPAKFDLIFDHCTLFTKDVPWHEGDGKMRADMLLKETPHLVLVLVGENVSKAFGIKTEPLFQPFALAEGEEGKERVFMAIKIVATTKDRFYKKDANRLLAKQVLGDLVTMCQLPASAEDARIACAIIRAALGDSMSIWTKKHVEDVERKLEAGELVDKHDMSQMMAAYASDVRQWVRPGEDNDALPS